MPSPALPPASWGTLGESLPYRGLSFPSCAMKELTTVPSALVFYIPSLSCFLPEILQPRDSGVLTHKSQTKLPWGPSEGPDAVVKTDTSEGRKEPGV